MPHDTRPKWPYPFWIAHRGAGTLAPENTLAAFQVGAQHGYQAFECDVKLSADNIPFLLHDDTLERTTSAHGLAHEQPWKTLKALDAGAWHSPAYAGQMIPALQTIAEHCLMQKHALNIELKPAPGKARAYTTGQIVAQAAAHWWGQSPTPPWLSSFSAAALEGAYQGAVHLPRALLVEHVGAEQWYLASELQCFAMVVNHQHLNEKIIRQIHACHLYCCAYTVNEHEKIHALIRAGIDAIITDAIDKNTP
jgi:glycerophosphoryl diester phosphodiesterase